MEPVTKLYQCGSRRCARWAAVPEARDESKGTVTMRCPLCGWAVPRVMPEFYEEGSNDG